MAIRKFISAYRQRSEKADEERRARVEGPQRQTEREKRETVENNYRDHVVGAIKDINHQTRIGQHQRAAQAQHRAMGECRRFWLDVAAVIVAAVAAYYLLRQQHTMQGQLGEMRAEQRPWVYADNVAVGGPLYFRHADMRVTLIYKLKNVGKSVATRVVVVAGILPLSDERQQPGATWTFGSSLIPPNPNTALTAGAPMINPNIGQNEWEKMGTASCDVLFKQNYAREAALHLPQLAPEVVFPGESIDEPTVAFSNISISPSAKSYVGNVIFCIRYQFADDVLTTYYFGFVAQRDPTDSNKGLSLDPAKDVIDEGNLAYYPGMRGAD